MLNKIVGTGSQTRATGFRYGGSLAAPSVGLGSRMLGVLRTAGRGVGFGRRRAENAQTARSEDVGYPPAERTRTVLFGEGL